MEEKILEFLLSIVKDLLVDYIKIWWQEEQ